MRTVLFDAAYGAVWIRLDSGVMVRHLADLKVLHLVRSLIGRRLNLLTPVLYRPRRVVAGLLSFTNGPADRRFISCCGATVDGSADPNRSTHRALLRMHPA
jgi:hypothetical protein